MLWINFVWLIVQSKCLEMKNPQRLQCDSHAVLIFLIQRSTKNDQWSIRVAVVSAVLLMSVRVVDHAVPPNSFNDHDRCRFGAISVVPVYGPKNGNFQLIFQIFLPVSTSFHCLFGNWFDFERKLLTIISLWQSNQRRDASTQLFKLTFAIEPRASRRWRRWLWRRRKNGE